MTDLKLNPPENLHCPRCGEVREHPQPFKNYDGRWFCGACYFADGQVIEMQHHPKETSL